MRYLGGKQKVANRFSDIINQLIDGKIYLEPFCGGLGATINFNLPKEYHLSDSNEYLISLYRSLINGWVPPRELSENEYKFYRDLERENKLDNTDPMSAFVGFACSYSGKWFGGIVRDRKTGRNLVNESVNNLLNKCLPVLKNASSVSCISYLDLEPTKDCFVYCDPPYSGTTGYSKNTFDSLKFWDTMRLWTRIGATVVISESSAPEDFHSIWSQTRKVYPNKHSEHKELKENLFVHKVD